MLLVEVAGSAHSCWASTSSSEKERRRSAAAAAAARRKRFEGMRYLDELRHASLLFPPPRHSPEDYDRIYTLGIYKAGSKTTRVIHSAPDPFWCDEGYDSSSTEHDDYSPLPSPWFVKSEGGISPTEPGFSIPFIDREPERRGRMQRGSLYTHGYCFLMTTRCSSPTVSTPTSPMTSSPSPRTLSSPSAPMTRPKLSRFWRKGSSRSQARRGRRSSPASVPPRNRSVRLRHLFCTRVRSG